MSKYSARRLRQNRYKNYSKRVDQWNRLSQADKVKQGHPQFCHICYYVKCRCDNFPPLLTKVLIK